MKILLLVFTFLISFSAVAQQTPFEKSKHKETATYQEVISFYEALVKKYPQQAQLFTYGTTDFGKPLHLLVLSKKQLFDPASAKRNNQPILLINNGIHPGEPEGIDASMLLARDLLQEKKLPEDVVICIIPVYNIDGMHNRSGTSRANQNGPVAYGFRGNSKNYDLNRDFIKTDSKNAVAFQQLFNLWQPEIFVDTHTSNGADYQYTMTLIPTQKDKLHPVLSSYLTQTMVPDLYQLMKGKGFDLVPYVNAIEETPDSGITGFMESPRYSTGYAALHNTIGFMPETHMLKAFDQRVFATYHLLDTYVSIVQRDAKLIGAQKKKADEMVAKQVQFPLNWTLNKRMSDSISFNGFEAGYKKSEVSGLDRLYYDRNKPYSKKIKQFNTFEGINMVTKPVAYLIPKAWDKVISLLQLNNVKLQQLSNDSKIEVEMYYIEDYKTSSRPYEGHYQHSGVKLKKVQQTIPYYAGDYLVYVNQSSNRYIIETLEPEAVDSFFNWNFFDSILGQKEGYSAYIFEDTSAELLKKDADLSRRFKEEKEKNPLAYQTAREQLDWVYKNSSYYEKTSMRYPIGRLLKEINITTHDAIPK